MWLCFLLCGIYRSWNHWLIYVGRDCRRSSGSVSFSNKGQMTLSNLICNNFIFSQVLSISSSSVWPPLLPNVYLEFLLLQFVLFFFLLYWNTFANLLYLNAMLCLITATSSSIDRSAPLEIGLQRSTQGTVKNNFEVYCMKIYYDLAFLMSSFSCS